MKKDTVNQKIKLLYFQYRDFLFPCFIMLICIVLFTVVVIPQIQEVISLENQLAANRDKLEILQKNFQQITGLDDQTVNNDFTLTTTALPLQRDPVAILNTISHAANLTNISLKDYNFEVGKVTSKTTTSVQPVQLNLFVKGDLGNIQKFVHQLLNGFPLASVDTIDITGTASAKLQVAFYSQPFVSPSFDAKEPLQLLNTNDNAMLNQLTAWKTSSQ